MANSLAFNEGNLNITNITEYPNSFKRQGAFPLERFSVFGTYDAAVDYAKNNPVAYVGQEIIVADGTVVRVFVIKNIAGDLAELGMTTSTGDLQTDLDNFKKTVNTSLTTINSTIETIQGNITTIQTKLSGIEEGAQKNIIESIKLADDTTGEVTTSEKEVTISIDKVASATTADTATIANKTKGKLKISDTKSFDGSNTEDITITLSDLGYEAKETALKDLINEKSQFYADLSSEIANPEGPTSYRVGDFGLYNGDLYVCTEIATGASSRRTWKKVTPDIVDELTSTDKTKVLSAAQGKVLKDAIDKLNGDSTVEGSVDSKVATAVAQIIADAPEAYDTLKEIADWIAAHPEDTTAMNTAIQTNATAIEQLKTLVGTLPKDTDFADVMAYIASKADKATTLTGYGITDAYTKNEVKEQINSNSNKIYIDLMNTPLPTTNEGNNYKMGDAVFNSVKQQLSILYRAQLTNPDLDIYYFEWLSLLPEVVDNLESDNNVYALSAKQGKVLKDLVDTKANDADLATVAKTGKIDDLTQTKTIVFVAGNAASIV